MNNPLGVSPSKGKQGTTRGKEKNSFDLGGNRTKDLRIRSTVTLPTERLSVTLLSVRPCSTICVPSATRHNIHMYHLGSFVTRT